jgi:hypothetical protein
MVLAEEDVRLELPASEDEPAYMKYDKMDDVMGQAWVADENDVWRMATVRGVSTDAQTLYVIDPDGMEALARDK